MMSPSSRFPSEEVSRRNEEVVMAESKMCPKCGAELPQNAPSGICPKCLMQAGLESERGGESASEMNPTTLASGFVPPEPEDLDKRFPQLEILELLGKGGMGAVYKARQLGLDRLAAVKILPPEIGADPAFAERFVREARALAKLSHQNIVSVFDFGQTDGQYYFIMEYVDGANLRHLIETGGLEPEEALAIVPQICEALQFAHDEGIVHRDIKPENILVDKPGRVKIADFGLAKLLGNAAASHTLTGTHQAMGTLHYMAPEQMRGAGAVDHRADIFSLGVVFYEMLTGQLPMGKFEPPSKKVHVDVRLDDVVLRSLESEPSRRYQRASDVKSDVETIASVSSQPISAVREIQGVDRQSSGPVSHEFFTMSREEAEFGLLPDLCMVCGKPTRNRVAKTFSYAPVWAGFLYVVLFVFFFPAGILAVILLNEDVRMSCPVCPAHRRHWSRLVWFASLGWLLIAAGAGIGLGTAFAADLSSGWFVAYGVGGVMIGVALYVIPLVYLSTTRVAVDLITEDSISFKRVSSAFARAVTANCEQRSDRGLS
jgi:predicted Ser/Thr protein kinase